MGKKKTGIIIGVVLAVLLVILVFLSSAFNIVDFGEEEDVGDDKADDDSDYSFFDLTGGAGGGADPNADADADDSDSGGILGWLFGTGADSDADSDATGGASSDADGSDSDSSDATGTTSGGAGGSDATGTGTPSGISSCDGYCLSIGANMGGSCIIDQFGAPIESCSVNGGTYAAGGNQYCAVAGMICCCDTV